MPGRSVDSDPSVRALIHLASPMSCLFVARAGEATLLEDRVAQTWHCSQK